MKRSGVTFFRTSSELVPAGGQLARPVAGSAAVQAESTVSAKVYMCCSVRHGQSAETTGAAPISQPTKTHSSSSLI